MWKHPAEVAYLKNSAAVDVAIATTPLPSLGRGADIISAQLLVHNVDSLGWRPAPNGAQPQSQLLYKNQYVIWLYVYAGHVEGEGGKEGSSTYV